MSEVTVHIRCGGAIHSVQVEWNKHGITIQVVPAHIAILHRLALTEDAPCMQLCERLKMLSDGCPQVEDILSAFADLIGFIVDVRELSEALRMIRTHLVSE